ncbi:hypothetical protein O6H91_14G029000 [Diphasiastrum complanatum]|uniref:Uncharacterized protein n=1 Tax=Diphasiastrum complanatum TaxID=34168 RepID=A0ACC2BMR4_DIPCM|nr:hypothetical protein O6H91_14G029000 [Diphasiastrum complanatum]
MAQADASPAGAGEWLEKALLSMCDDDSTTGLQLDPEVVTSLVSYCQLAPPSDAGEYLSSIFGHERSKDVVAEYLQRRGTSSSNSQIDSYGEPLQAYVKAKTEEVWSTCNKKMNKASKKKNGLLGGEEVTSTTENVHGQSADITTSSLKANRPKSRGKKGAKGVSLAETAEGTILFPRGGPCNCQARRHKLINNCLSCGKIVCEQEGEGPCNFCGTLVLTEGSSYAGLEGGVLAISEAEAAAQAFKDRLVEYNKNSALRTAVIDDQSDYFETEGNSWISDKEKHLLEKKREEVEQAELERRKHVIVTIDLLGRKVVMADNGSSKEAGGGESILLGSTPFKDEGADKVARIKPNPYIAEIPCFVETQSLNHGGSKKQNREKTEKLMKSGRIQHNDPVTEALTSRNSRGAVSDCVDNSWEEQNLKDDCAFAADDGDGLECKLETMPANLRYLDGRKSILKQPALTTKVVNDNYSYTAWNSLKDSSSKGNSPVVFDICEPPVQAEIGSRQRPMNLASPLLQKQVDRVASLEGVPGKMLHPGLVLLKNWLSMDEQINIIKECQQFGKGVGGFYKPTYGDGNAMHLWMMCLGKHWEPTMSSYLDKRVNYDNSTPPPIPLAFVSLVEKALLVAQSVCAKDSSIRRMRSKIEQEILPSMRPDVCIVNFYERSGKLGMHQDKDESSESLARGAPVISFSIGDTAEFYYGNDRKAQNSKHLFLESGDVLIFGGSARMIYHGVESILPGTAPSWLTSKTNLRPGRLNLTFREL